MASSCQVVSFLRPSAVAARGRVDSGQRGGRGGGVPREAIRQPQDDAAHNAEVDALIAAAPPLRVARSSCCSLIISFFHFTSLHPQTFHFA